MAASELRIAIFGKKQNEKTAVINILAGSENTSQQKPIGQFQIIHGNWKYTPYTLVQTPDISGLPEDKQKMKMKMCVLNCPPGPHTLLLVVNPLDFTEEDRTRLKTTLSFFGEDAFKYSIVILTKSVVGYNPSVNHLIRSCDHKNHIINLEEDHFSLVTQIYQMVEVNKSKYLTLLEEQNTRINDQQQVTHLNVSRETSDLYPRKEPPIVKPRKSCTRRRTFDSSTPRPMLTDRRCSMTTSREFNDQQQVTHLNVSRETSDLYPRKEPPIVKPRKSCTRRQTFDSSTPPPMLTDRRCSMTTSQEFCVVPGINCLRIGLIGKTGSGKSATGNTLLNEDCFESKACAQSVTNECQKVTGEIEGRVVEIVDTPGLCDTRFSNNKIKQELVSCISLLSPGPHVLLLVVQICRMTKEEQLTVQLIKELFGKTSENHILILFTRGDELDGQSIQSYIQEDQKGFLKNLIAECGGRYHVLNNRNRSDRAQVIQLMKKMVKLVQNNGGGYYTSKLFQEAEAAIQTKTMVNLKGMEEEDKKRTRELERQHEEGMEVKEKTWRKKINFFQHTIDALEENIRIKTESKQRIAHKSKQTAVHKERVPALLRQNQSPPVEQAFGKMVLSQSNVESQRLAVRDETSECLEEPLYQNPELLETEQTLQELRNEVYQIKSQCENIKLQHAKELQEQQENFTKQMFTLKQRNSEKARQLAEQNNEFKDRFTLSTEPKDKLQREHNNQMIALLTKSKTNKKSYDELKKTQGEETKELKCQLCLGKREDLIKAINDQKEEHLKEEEEWIQEHIDKARLNESCVII